MKCQCDVLNCRFKLREGYIFSLVKLHQRHQQHHHKLHQRLVYQTFMYDEFHCRLRSLKDPNRSFIKLHQRVISPFPFQIVEILLSQEYD